MATSHEEYQYLNLVRDVLARGVDRDDRTGVGTRSLFGAQLRFSLADGAFPLLTTKRVFWRGVVEELLWMIAGSTDSLALSARGVRVWDANASRKFLDEAGFEHRRVGDLGPIYGFQWRRWGADYVDADHAYDHEGIDQLARVVRQVRDTPNDRRIVLSAWNVADIDRMALPPCHVVAQFYVADDRLSCMMFQRSADLGLGLPFNIASYALLTTMIARVAGRRRLGDLIVSIGDAHVYATHADALREQLRREPRPFPTLRIARDDVADIDSFRSDDFQLIGYNPHDSIAMPMAI